MSKKYYISLILDSPLQSWGVSSHPGIDFRTTLRHPTKSGVIGILSAAIGIDRFSSEEPKLIKSLSKQIKVKFFEIPKFSETSEKKLMGQKITDFTTIDNALNAEGEKRKGSVVSKKEYLSDMRFAAILEIEDKECAAQVGKALKNPKWGIWLGRKCCIPSLPIFVEINTEEKKVFEAIWEKFNKLGIKYGKSTDFFSVESLDKNYIFQKGDLRDIIMDEPLSFSRPNCYVSRKIVKRYPQGEDAPL